MDADDGSVIAQSLIRMALQAPSSHNTQPWLFRVSGSAIDLLADRTRALPVNDPEDRELAISCGCALMNLRIAAASQGLRAQIQLLPDSKEPDWLARVVLSQESPAPIKDTVLADHIGGRRTYRRRFAPREVDSATVDQLVEAGTMEGAWLRPLRTAEAQEQAAALVAEGNAVQWADPCWRRELARWIRPRRRGDGLPVPALAAPLIRLLLRHFDLGRTAGEKDRQLARTAPLLAVLGTDSDHPREWLRAGQALQRTLLVACRQGLQASYLNQPVQVASLRPKLRHLIGGGFPQMLLRLGYPAEEIPAAARRRIEDVIREPLP